MKFKILLLMLVFFVAQAAGEPLLVVVLMVKNEAPVLTQTLQPFVDGGVQDFVIFDTGSTDGTQDVARAFFKQHNLEHASLFEEPFVDFSTSRNRALDEAERLFPQATFMLMLDAEWYMHNVEGLVHFCREHKADYQNSYLISIRSTELAFYVRRLIRCHKGVRFIGAVHEDLNTITWITVPDLSYFEWRPSQKGREKSLQRWQRDRDLLLKSYAKNPSDPRTLFYLAQTYECLGDWENAYTFYTKRSCIRSWDEENFMTLFRLGGIAQQLATKDDNRIYPPAIKQYLEAFALRPHRAEPLIKIAQYYLDKNEMALAFLFAARAVEIPYPAKDVLFVEKYLYDFVRYDILGRSAWYVGEYELGEWAVRKALEIQPESSYLKRHLKCYTDRMASI